MKKLLFSLIVFSFAALMCACTEDDEAICGQGNGTDTLYIDRTDTLTVTDTTYLYIHETDTLYINNTDYYAVTESFTYGKSTKAAVESNDTRSVLWGDGDALNVWSRLEGESGKYVVTTAGTTASMIELDGDAGTDAGFTNNVGYYPYSESVSCTYDSGVYTFSGIELSSTQSYVEGTYDVNAAPMVAVATDTTKILEGKNLVGLVKITLKDASESPITVKSITFAGNNSEVIAGAATVTASEGNDPEVTMGDGGATSITLDCGDGVVLTADGVDFFIALAPVSLESGYTIKVTDPEGFATTLSDDAAVEVVRSGIVTINPYGDEGGEESGNYIVFTSEGTSTLTLSKSGSPTVTPYLEYSFDGTSWKEWDYSAITYSTLYLRGKGNTAFASGTSKYYYFVMGGDNNASVSGNIMTLLDYENPDEVTMGDYCFLYLFKNCAKLSDISNLSLPATTLSIYCYEYMFRGCSGLTKIMSELPATTLADYCYYGMFYECSSLESVSEDLLPAETMATQCYARMFQYCSALSVAPKLPATTLASYCYYCMFYRTALTTAPELSATTLADHCYQAMFNYCRSLSNVQESLPATTLADHCYYSMFDGCTSLTAAPSIAATSMEGSWNLACMFQGCIALTSAPAELKSEDVTKCGYYAMFDSCSALTTAPEIEAKVLGNCCFESMFSYCTALTEAPELNAEEIAGTCYHGMFRGCTSLTTAPKLPAVVAPDSCYRYMFYGCTSLTTAPELPATTLGKWSYAYMFYGCEKLDYIKCLATDITTPTDPTLNWVEGVASTGTFVCADGMEDTWKGSSSTDYNHAPYFWTIQTDAGEGEENTNYITFTSEGTSTLQLKTNGSPTVTPYLEYSTDGKTWQAWDYSEISYNTLYLRGKGNTAFATDYDAYYHFVMGGDKASCSGNIMTLLDYENPDEVAMGDFCFYGLFSNCTSLTTAPELPATVLAESCYASMFDGCTSLTTAPELPATTLAESCYASMFDGCTALTSAPELPATNNLVDFCYYGMFYGCTSLTTAPELPATTLAESCYDSMFSGCTALATAPELPATTLAESCYSEMFCGTRLVSAPELPATTLANYCYQNMFYDCTHLTTAPELPATTLASSCYMNMFNGCTALNYIKCLATDISATNCTNNWVSGVASSGKFVRNEAMDVTTDGSDGTWAYPSVSGIPENWEIDPPVEEEENTNCITFTSEGTSTLALSKNGSPSVTPYLEYSTDGKTWQAWDYSEISYNTLYLRGKGNTAFASGTAHYYYFVMGGTNKASCSGNIMTLLDYENPDEVAMGDYGFLNLFKSCAKLTDISELSLPATTLSKYCYYMMFKGCTGLTTLPENLLPATTLASHCYAYMFDGCTFLTTAPALPATTLATYCYASMFSSCIYLTTAPELPATTLATYCYQYMFKTCTSLTTAPALPATTLANSCYAYMFNGCTGLTTLPENLLPATTLVDWCYAYMFYGCKSLTTAPALPATTLAVLCYSYMFHGCTSLTTAPELPATTLAEKCYQEMFDGCTSLNYIKCLATDISASNCTNNWVSGVASSGTFVRNEAMDVTTDGSDGTWAYPSVSGIPENWDIDPPVETEENTNYITFTSEGTSTLSLSKINSPSVTPYLEYSLDGTSWQEWDYSVITYSTLYLRGKGNTVFASKSGSTYNYYYFKMERDNASCSGNIMTLLDYENPDEVAMGDYCFYSLFYGCTSLTTAPELPATTLATYCYVQMFRGCTSLTIAPALPATTLAANCYAYMFYDCSSLTTAPELPATILASQCYYQMFYNCTSLTTAPELPATTLEDWCYGFMFYKCTALTTAPELPATTLPTSCYNSMFSGCKALNYIKCLATDISADKCTNAWVNDVANSGTFICAEGMTDTWNATSNADYSHAPYNWTITPVGSE